jgi:hypothetical protein
MVRARLKFLALAGGLLLSTGCCATHTSECCDSGWFSRFHLASRKTAAPCECQTAGMSYSGTDGSIVVPPNAFVPPTTYTGPAPTVITNPPLPGQAPRIVPVPQQANPVPYTPGL